MEAKPLWRIILDFLIYLFKRKEQSNQAQADRLENTQNELENEYNKIDEENDHKHEEDKQSDIDKVADRLNDRF